MRGIRAKSCIALDVVVTFWCTFCDHNVQQNDAVDRLRFLRRLTRCNSKDGIHTSIDSNDNL